MKTSTSSPRNARNAFAALVIVSVFTLTTGNAAAQVLTGWSYRKAELAKSGKLAEPVLRYLVPTTPANYVINPGTGLDGVARVEVTRIGGGVDICTGTLLPTGRHVLVAAHCICDLNTGAINASSANVIFEMLGGNTTINVTSAGAFLRPGTFNGDVSQTPDIAVIVLPQLAPAAAQRWEIYRQTNEAGLVGLNKVGYGNTGEGATGEVVGTLGVKRGRSNRYDTAAEAWNGKSGFPPNTFSAGNQLCYDFDSGVAANDANGAVLGLNNLGLGNDEVNSAPGDSGGPTFIGGRIAGIVSWGIGFSGLPDVNKVTDSSFGEISFDTRLCLRTPFVRGSGVADSVG